MLKVVEELKNTMEDLLHRLDEWLQKNRPNYYTQLAPGLSDKELVEFEKTLGLKLPADFKLFYKWKNGPLKKGSTGRSLFSRYKLMSTRQIVAFCEMMNQSSDEEESFDEFWNKNWVPFLNDYHSTRYCLDLYGSFNGKPGQVVEIVSDMVDSNCVLHESFYKWLETLVLAIEKGFLIYSKEEDNMFEKNWDEYYRFYQENNPGYPIEVNQDEDI